MPVSDLITTLVKQSAFVDASDAEMAVTTTLETLGFVLPARLVRELEAVLPEPCGWPLAFGRSVSDNQRRAAQRLKPAAPGDLPGPAVERIEEVCKVLARLLPPELIAGIARELPAQLRGAFQPRPATTLPPPGRGLSHTIAGGRPGSSHPVSEARPGSRRPLSASSGVRSGSLDDANPHGDTKLSSARGTTQEREHETIAGALRGR